MLTPDEMRAKIVDKAAEDADFRALLLSDPKSAVEQELDLSIPSGFTVEVHEEGGSTAHLVLPPPQCFGRSRFGGVQRRAGKKQTMGRSRSPDMGRLEHGQLVVPVVLRGARSDS